jgi:hypothetical protein
LILKTKLEGYTGKVSGNSGLQGKYSRIRSYDYFFWGVRVRGMRDGLQRENVQDPPWPFSEERAQYSLVLRSSVRIRRQKAREFVAISVQLTAIIDYTHPLMRG